jgi:hypothetical protein
MTLDHPYVKALRRGFGIYVDDSSLQEYPRVVQQLAQQVTRRHHINTTAPSSQVFH